VVGAPQAKPEKFGRYVLLDRIGAGGMAEVFRAVMPGAEGFRQTLVVKRILAERAGAADFVEMFVQEARIGALLNHPNIVQVFDFGSVGRDYFLAMEYLRGHDVSAVNRKLRERQAFVPVPVAAFVAYEVAACLSYAHALTDADGKRLNIVHRDVSPSNIMCLRTGGVKLLDFGIAKVFGEAGGEHTQQGLFKGKIAYVSPERINNEPFDGRADLFSLGIVLWEMLAGRRLFKGKSEIETLKNVLEMPVPPPSSVRPEIPASLDAVVMRALQRHPDARYPNGQAMADDLEKVLQETKLAVRMLPDLLNDLFGSSTTNQAMAALTPELLAQCADDPDSHTELPSVKTVAPPRRRPRPLLSAAAAISWTAALGALLLVRGGGGQSNASELTQSLPAAVSVRQMPNPIVVPTTPVSAPAPVEPAPEPARAAAEDEPTAPAPTRRRTSRKRVRAERDRVLRGLSIDPFAEAKSR
jgi:serine/threonine protein kinase